MSFRTRTHGSAGQKGKRFPVDQGRKTAFEQPSDKELAEIVRGSSVSSSEESVRELESKFRRSKTLAEKERIRKATQLEANRLDIGAHNHRNSAEARKSLAERSKVFDRTAERMGRQLRREKASGPKGRDPPGRTYLYEFGGVKEARDDPNGPPVVTVEARNKEEAWEEVTEKVAGSEAFPKKPTVAEAKKELFLEGRVPA